MVSITTVSRPLTCFKNELTRNEFSLVLSWVMTVHESQSQSFVALSRVRNIESTVIKSFSMHRDRVTKISKHNRYKKVKSKYARLEALSK